MKLWPAKELARLAVLEYLISKFNEEAFYPESEVNEILKAWHTF